MRRFRDFFGNTTYKLKAGGGVDKGRGEVVSFHRHLSVLATYTGMLDIPRTRDILNFTGIILTNSRLLLIKGT